MMEGGQNESLVSMSKNAEGNEAAFYPPLGPIQKRLGEKKDANIP
jgi:hypothetical protein